MNPTRLAFQQAEAEGADILVSTGFNEGGVLPNHRLNTLDILSELINITNTPVLAAGGIVDSSTAEAIMLKGADGLYVGTRFILSEECPTAETTKELILKSTHENQIFVSDNYRSLNTKFAVALNKLYMNSKEFDTNKIVSKNGGLRHGMLEGNFDDGIISVNTNIGKINSVNKVSEIIAELSEGIYLAN